MNTDDRELFPNFQRTEEAFSEAVAFWYAMMLQASDDTDQSGEWRQDYGEIGEVRPPVPTDPLEDRTTFEGYSPTLRRMFQIYQYPREDGAPLCEPEVEFATKTMTFDDDTPPIRILLIRLVATQRTTDLVRRALRLFMTTRQGDKSLAKTLAALN